MRMVRVAVKCLAAEPSRLDQRDTGALTVTSTLQQVTAVLRKERAWLLDPGMLFRRSTSLIGACQYDAY